jgi:hypothetical protein
MASFMTRTALGCTALFAVALSCAQTQDNQRPRKWANAFDSYRVHIRPLGPTAAKACETQLRRVLEAIDENQACTVDSDCTLVREEPFGQTVPVRSVGATTVTAAMREFRTSCNNESMQASYNSELVHSPACVQSRCMVKTSFKK